MVKRKLELSQPSETTPPESKTEQPRKRKKVIASDFSPVNSDVLPKESRLDLADAEIYYVPDFIEPETAKRWYDELLALDTWYQPTLKMYGRSFLQSRQIVAFGDDDAAEAIKYSGTEVPLVKEHPSILQEIQVEVEKKLGVSFNHCMLNRYDNGSVHIGAHSDNLENLCIASISLGAERDFILSHKKPPTEQAGDRYRKRFALANGSLVVMQGETQRFWKHEIPKQLKVKKGRISLTFRQLIDK